jgi:hypothetical protein
MSLIKIPEKLTKYEKQLWDLIQLQNEVIFNDELNNYKHRHLKRQIVIDVIRALDHHKKK